MIPTCEICFMNPAAHFEAKGDRKWRCSVCYANRLVEKHRCNTCGKTNDECVKQIRRFGGTACCATCQHTDTHNNPPNKEVPVTSKIREGDHVVAEYKGHRFEGEVWKHDGFRLVGATYIDGPSDLVVIIEHRPAPKPLPTGPNAVITDVVMADGQHWPLARLHGGLWVVYNSRGDVAFKQLDGKKHFASWTELVAKTDD